MRGRSARSESQAPPPPGAAAVKAAAPAIFFAACRFRRLLIAVFLLGHLRLFGTHGTGLEGATALNTVLDRRDDAFLAVINIEDPQFTVDHAGNQEAEAALRNHFRGADLCEGNTSLLRAIPIRSEEHTSELQSLMRISYADFCLKKKKGKHKYIVSTHKELITSHV